MATEKRLISLDEAIAKIKDDGILGAGYDDAEREDDVIDMLESCHIVDAVEVVRCKNCRYYEKAEYDEGYKMVCRLLKRKTASNGFCYCGEGKDNECAG